MVLLQAAAEALQLRLVQQAGQAALLLEKLLEQYQTQLQILGLERAEYLLTQEEIQREQAVQDL